MELAPEESESVTFTVTEEQLRYHHADLRCASDPGTFRIYVGPNSRDTAEHSFRLSRSN
ncbi:fibronectin type III-like domain-contianing protein [Paenibacillus thiaminolyticus]